VNAVRRRAGIGLQDASGERFKRAAFGRENVDWGAPRQGVAVKGINRSFQPGRFPHQREIRCCRAQQKEKRTRQGLAIHVGLQRKTQPRAHCLFQYQHAITFERRHGWN
jgi:hypothetical protein